MLTTMENLAKLKTSKTQLVLPSLIVFLLMMILPNLMWGQKIKNKYLRYSSVNLPVDKLSDDIKTYSVKINEVASRYGNILGGEHVADTYLKMPGYERVESNGDIAMNVRFISGVRPGEVKLQQKKVAATKKKDGTIKTPAYTKYWYTVKYFTPSYAMTITSKDGESIIDGNYGGDEKSVSWGDATTYKSSYTLNKDWRASKEGFYGAQESKYGAVGAARNFIKKHCLTKVKGSDNFKYVKKFKKHKYDDLNKAVDKMKAGLEACKEDRIGYTNKLLRVGYTAHKENVSEAIAIWEKALGQHKKGEKKARINDKVANMLYYNLAKAYSLMYDFDNANKYLKKAIANKAKGKKYLEKGIKKKKVAYEANTWRGDDLTSAPSDEEMSAQNGGEMAEESEEEYYDDTADGEEMEEEEDDGN